MKYIVVYRDLGHLNTSQSIWVVHSTEDIMRIRLDEQEVSSALCEREDIANKILFICLSFNFWNLGSLGHIKISPPKKKLTCCTSSHYIWEMSTALGVKQHILVGYIELSNNRTWGCQLWVGIRRREHFTHIQTAI